ncbi:hypothetical protein SAMD00020551_0575 [Mesobacillus selenatarsenatis SF-1]|uniref:Uncharacterized protein n=1 Tax=Mesobacillus selenatarsenatis (strain DSM 18680 / JCM 14380 / FERM P-15431 / SF-1) TaxID=1321606 RepID=A0A0A8X2W0_MESS1|nr:hypothetical protein SAMD00020551_0575 [Mesobacillus selenatarsenatis SF-1]
MAKKYPLNWLNTQILLFRGKLQKMDSLFLINEFIFNERVR